MDGSAHVLEQTITTDENKTRNASEQENEFAWSLIMEKQTQKREKTKYNEVI